MTSLCFVMFLFMQKILFQKEKKKKHLAERIGNDKNRNWLFSEKTISSEKKKKSERIIRSYGCYGVIEMIIISKKAFPTVVYSIIKRN